MLNSCPKLVGTPGTQLICPLFQKTKMSTFSMYFFFYCLYKLFKLYSYKPNIQPVLPLASFLGKSFGNASALFPTPLGSSIQAGRSTWGAGLEDK